MDLDAIAVFVKVVQAGSFTHAARLLGMPNTTVSAKVAALERRLGVTLIQRTTRKLHITPAGEAYFRKCVHALEEIQSAEREVSAARGEPKGVLRITAPVDLGHSLLVPLVRTYLQKFPQVGIDLLITNRVVDLVAEGVDLAIRAGALKDSTLIAKKFISASMMLWAAPAFLKKAGGISHPRDVERLECIRFTVFRAGRIELTNGREKFKLAMSGRVGADDLEAVKAFVLLGQGIGLLPSYLCEAELEVGKLQPILPRWYLDAGRLSLVYPAQRFVSPLVQSFLEVATAGSK